MISGCNARCLTLIFLRLAPFPRPSPSLSILALFSSLSLPLKPRRVAFGFTVLVALIAPRGFYPFDSPIPLSHLLPVFSVFLLFLLFVPLRSESLPERRPIWRHRTKCVKARRDPQRHTRTRTRTISYSLRVPVIFNLPQGGCAADLRTPFLRNGIL